MRKRRILRSLPSPYPERLSRNHFINGTDYGKTNRFVYGVPAGVRNLTLTRTGYQPYTLLVTVPAGGTKVLAPITLTKGD